MPCVKCFALGNNLNRCSKLLWFLLMKNKITPLYIYITYMCNASKISDCEKEEEASECTKKLPESTNSVKIGVCRMVCV